MRHAGDLKKNYERRIIHDYIRRIISICSQVEAEDRIVIFKNNMIKCKKNYVYFHPFSN